MLNQEQAREYNRFKKLKLYLDANGDIIATYVPFQEEVAHFVSNFNKLDGYIPKKGANGTGITSDKTALKHSVSDRLALICATTKAYALKQKNGELAAQMNLNATQIFTVKDADFLALALNIQSYITPLITDGTFIPYGITAATLTDIVGDAEDFNNLIGAADFETSGSSVANQNIDDTIKLLDENLVQFDLLIDNFLANNPDFVAGYHISSAVDNTGVRHSGIEGNVTANGQAIGGAHVKLVDKNKSAVADLYGHYSIIRVPTGDYTVEVQAPGFVTKTLIIHIGRGKISAVNFELAAA